MSNQRIIKYFLYNTLVTAFCDVHVFRSSSVAKSNGFWAINFISTSAVTSSSANANPESEARNPPKIALNNGL